MMNINENQSQANGTAASKSDGAFSSSFQNNIAGGVSFAQANSGAQVYATQALNTLNNDSTMVAVKEMMLQRPDR